jgi:hypothetical protein
MSALQVEFTQNLVGTRSFSPSSLDVLFHFVWRAASGFLEKVLRSKIEPKKTGVVASSPSSAAPLGSDMVHISHHLSNHDNQRSRSLKTEYPSYPTSCLSRQLKPIHINERQPDARFCANAKAVATRERYGAMRGVSHVGHRIKFTRDTTGSRTTGCRTTGCRTTGCRTTGCRTTGCRTTGCRTSDAQAPNRGFNACAKSCYPSKFGSNCSR